jgi:hypothetical protein
MQLEQDDHQRRDAQQQVEEVLGDAQRDRQRRAQQQPWVNQPYHPEREVADVSPVPFELRAPL